MPTEFVAQDAAVIHESTTIAVTGCAAKDKRKANAKQSSRARKSSHVRGRRS
jgi:hypothetical protein